MRTICILIAFLLLQPCYGQTKSGSKDHPGLIVDFNSLIGKSIKVDPQKNPFLENDHKKSISNCKTLEDRKYHFTCVLKSFRESTPPIELGPTPEPKQEFIDDSIFIVNCLNDKKYYTIPYGDRTYNHLFGAIVNRTESYILCIIPYRNCCSNIYNLYTFTLSGEMIDKIIIGGLVSDISESYGFLSKKNKFRVITNEFGFVGDKAFISKTIDFKYNISKTGKFSKQ